MITLLKMTAPGLTALVSATAQPTTGINASGNLVEAGHRFPESTVAAPGAVPNE